MKASTMVCIGIGITFGCLVGYQNATAAEERQSTAKVTGIGGVFFLSRGEGKTLSAWYEKHLGMRLESFGAAVLNWEDDTAEDKGVTVWHVGDRGSDWFQPSTSTFMINYRVDDLEAMVDQLTASGIEILQGPEYHENGAFAWIMDPEGNKIELWEPKIWDERNKR
jgi:predicted enzyme related to lactoylglutathione lyase